MCRIQSLFFRMHLLWVGLDKDELKCKENTYLQISFLSKNSHLVLLALHASQAIFLTTLYSTACRGMTRLNTSFSPVLSLILSVPSITSSRLPVRVGLELEPPDSRKFERGGEGIMIMSLALSEATDPSGDSGIEMGLLDVPRPDIRGAPPRTGDVTCPSLIDIGKPGTRVAACCSTWSSAVGRSWFCSRNRLNMRASKSKVGSTAFDDGYECVQSAPLSRAKCPCG